MPRRPLPRIIESAAELLEIRRAERDERRREHLHLLWLLASGTVPDRQSAAAQLGRNRQTVGLWLKDDEQGGLQEFLRAPRPPGPDSQGGIGLPEETKAAIRVRLAGRQGERGYLSLWRWAQAEHALAQSYSHFQRWVRGQLGAKLKVAPQSHGGKKTRNWQPSAMAA